MIRSSWPWSPSPDSSRSAERQARWRFVRAALIVAAFTLAVATTARAQTAAPDTAPAAVRDTALSRVKPLLVMARSAVVPGWGQVYNRQPLKAVVVVAGEGFLTYKIFQELRRENEAIDRQIAAKSDAELNAALADELDHRNRKIDWIWWTAAAHLLQMADAYVDAHFLNFDAEFGPADERSGSRGDTRLSLSLHVRF